MINQLITHRLYMSPYIYKGLNHNASSSVLARIIAVESTSGSTAYTWVTNTMNVVAFVVVARWTTTRMRTNGNIEALSSSHESAFVRKVVVTNISQTAHEL